MTTIPRVSWQELKAFVDQSGATIKYFTYQNRDHIYAYEGNFVMHCRLRLDPTDSSDIQDWQDNYKSSANGALKSIVDVTSEPPFHAKTVGDKKLFQRVEGKSFAVTTAGNDNTLDFVVPYTACKFNGLEIIGGELGDKVKLNILDTDAGTVSTIPNYVLNTFGGKESKVCVAPDFYVRESNYDADLFVGLHISIEYETISDKTVYINYILHELKD